MAKTSKLSVYIKDKKMEKGSTHEKVIKVLNACVTIKVIEREDVEASIQLLRTGQARIDRQKRIISELTTVVNALAPQLNSNLKHLNKLLRDL